MALGVILIALNVGIYRLTLHPLANHPGPLLGALTNWYTIYWLLNGQRHLNLYRQHARYGKIVRYSPSRISINSPEASDDLHQVNANAHKGDFYSVAKVIFGADMSNTTVDKKKHAFRRRVNVTALTPAAVRGYGGQVATHVDELMRQMGERASSKQDHEGWGPPEDVSKSFAYCIADIMGCLTFGQSWNAQKNEQYRKIVEGSPLGVTGMMLLGHRQGLVRWNLHKVLFKELVDGIAHLTSTAASWADWREKQSNMAHRDIWAVLLEARDPKTGEPFTREELVSEAITLITAGTDTVITASCATMFYLVHNRAALTRLSREVRDVYPSPKPDGSDSELECPIQFASQELQGITFLFACIDEAMRLSPPLPGILPRTAGYGGIVVDGEFFPEGTTLGIPHYVLQRDSRNFPEPHSFIPERWMDETPEQGSAGESAASIAQQREQLKAGDGLARGYTPFGVGRGSCIGKHLAYQEMSYIIARLIWQFDVRAAPDDRAAGENKDRLDWREDEFRSKDRFVSSQEGPALQLRHRRELR